MNEHIKFILIMGSIIFILITFCYYAWSWANDETDKMTKRINAMNCKQLEEITTSNLSDYNDASYAEKVKVKKCL